MSESEQPRLDDLFVEEWSRSRGPLFKDARAAVCRIYGVILTGTICDTWDDPGLRVRAARILEEALAEVPDSNEPATPADRARVQALLVDVRRLHRRYRDLRQRGKAMDIHLEIKRLFIRQQKNCTATEEMRCIALGELLAATLCTDDAAIQLRAARALLARTRDAARRLGRRQTGDETTDAPARKRDKAHEPHEENSPVPVMPPPGSGPAPAAPAYACRGTSPP